jgi:hypothetical protein
MMVGASPAFSVHDDDIFELEGNAVDDVAVLGDDWSVIYDNYVEDPEDACASVAGDIAACSFTHDEVNHSTFTGGGSKDEQEVQTSWRHTDGSVPAKDDLLDAFAAQYDNGHLYFGADRYATNGDAQIGFWFFHNEISLNADGTFNGLHTAHDDGALPDDETDDTNGDILVLSNFSNGGNVPNIRVFEWYGVNDVRQISGADSLCGTTPGDEACAITSDNGVTSPWPFDPKSGPNDIFSSGAFYEGGVDLEALGFGGDCFSSFLAETRSSTSITATLKDFVLGGLGECGVSVTTEASDDVFSLANGPVNVSDSATVTGTGSALAPDPTGDVEFYLCGPTADITDCNATDGVLKATVGLPGDENPSTVSSGNIVISVPGDYCFFALYSGDDNYAETGDSSGASECFTVVAQPTVTTAQTWIPNDVASIDSGGGGALIGTAHFALFESADCGFAGEDVAVYSQDVLVEAPNDGSVDVPTTNAGAPAPAGYVATSSNEYSWQFSYTSTAEGQESIPATCVEVTTLTINNDNTPTP